MPFIAIFISKNLKLAYNIFVVEKQHILFFFHVIQGVKVMTHLFTPPTEEPEETEETLIDDLLSDDSDDWLSDIIGSDDDDDDIPEWLRN